MECQSRLDNVVPGNSVGKVILSRYELVKLLGYGASAKVFQAKHIKTGQSVAIKVIDKQKITKSGLIPQIKREISVMHQLRHPHIVELFEILATKSKIYIVMELQKNGELFDKIAQGKLTEDQSRQYFKQLISAVGFCHSKGIFHRDLKPENLLLNDNGDLKVTDFGLSTVKEQIRNDGQFHTVCGTPAYVSPDILSKKGYDAAKSDIWSCGVILFVMSVGYLPFNDTNLMKMYRKITNGLFRFPKWIPNDLRDLISRLLDTNPSTRITIGEVTRHPWFTKSNVTDQKFNTSVTNLELKPGEENKAGNLLNAFDIISFSSGLDLSELFMDAETPDSHRCIERFVTAKSDEEIMKKMEELAKGNELGFLKKGCIGEMDEQTGNLLIRVEFFKITTNLILVEAKAGTDEQKSRRFYREKLKPAITI